MQEHDTTANELESKEPVTSIKTLLSVWSALVAATVLTVWVSQLDLGRLHTILPLAIATSKCALVLFFFMRLRNEPRFFTVMLLITIATLATFIGLTFFDVSFR